MSRHQGNTEKHGMYVECSERGQNTDHRLQGILPNDTGLHANERRAGRLRG